METECSSWKTLFSLMSHILSWEESSLDSRGSTGNNTDCLCSADVKRVWVFGLGNKGSSPEPTPWERPKTFRKSHSPQSGSFKHWVTPSFGFCACPPGLTVTALSEGMWLSSGARKSKISLLPTWPGVQDGQTPCPVKRHLELPRLGKCWALVFVWWGAQ